ncbi:OmpA family protein [Camelimonas sp. ID_303_24]
MTMNRSGAVITIAGAALALMLGGCAAERFSFARLTGKQQAAPAAQAAAPTPFQSAPAQQVAAQPAPPRATPAVWTTPAEPAGKVTDAPVGAGVNVQPGGNEDFIVNVGRRVFFTEGSAQLTNIARDTLDSQAAWLKRFPKWNAKIQGFADDPGTDASNMTLGQQRAEVVMVYLVSKGVAANRLRAKSYGREQQRIVRACADASCTAQNRRVITNLEAGR